MRESDPRRKHVLIIVQNLPVPLDRRVWLECEALSRSGYSVSVICPRGPGDPHRAVLAGIRLYKYAPAPATSGVMSYLWEFIYCWVQTAILSIVVWRRERFHVLQACNPPDTYWLLGLIWRSRGVRFVFDHHDLNPEVFLARFGAPTKLSERLQMAGLRWLEKQTFRAADRVISTNESYRQIAVDRGGVDPEHVAVVRSGPDTSVMRPVPGNHVLKRGHRYLVVYLGIMGPQDGVDGVLGAAHRVLCHHGRTDIGFALLGFGDCLDDLRKQSTALGLDDHVYFTGRVGPAEIAAHLSTAVVGICPDPLNALNDVSTMNKTMEYMSYALPMVAYRLKETVVSAENCAVYVEPGNPDGLADELVSLVDDPDRRADLGSKGRRRVERELDWATQAERYVAVFDDLVGIARDPSRARPVQQEFSADVVDISSDENLRAFAATRMGAEMRQVDGEEGNSAPAWSDSDRVP